MLTTDRTADEERLIEEFKNNPANEENCHTIKAYELPTQGHHDPVDHPSHYNNSKAHCEKCHRRIECIDVTRHMCFNIGNAIKYLWRCDFKNSSVEDLRKAVWYIQDEIKQRLK